MAYFDTVKDLQEYSDIRFKIRLENHKIHRMKKGTINNIIAKNHVDSLCKNKNDEHLKMCLIESEYRNIITSFRLPVSVKIM